MSDLLFSAVFGSLRCRSFTLFTEDLRKSTGACADLQGFSPI